MISVIIHIIRKSIFTILILTITLFGTSHAFAEETLPLESEILIEEEVQPVTNEEAIVEYVEEVPPVNLQGPTGPIGYTEDGAITERYHHSLYGR